MQDLAEYRRQLWEHPQLRFLFFEMTDQCNLSCLHCGSSCTGINHTYLEYDLIERVMKSVADRYDPRNIMICITGGEPMLHPDIYETVKLAHDYGFPVGMTSNGTLINDDGAKALAYAGLDTIAVSLDGIEETHDAFRQSPGSFKRAMNGVHVLRSAGIEAQAITVIHRNNIHQLEDMFRFFNSDGFYSWRVVNIEPIGRANDNSNLILNAKEIEHLLNFIREKRFDNDNEMDDIDNTPQLPEERRKFIQESLDRWCANMGYKDSAANMLTLSSTLHISKNELSIYFDQCLKSTFRIWLSEIRFNAAKQMMTECPDYSNDIVSAECGFSSRTHLYRVFKAKEGCTPTVWREIHS